MGWGSCTRCLRGIHRRLSLGDSAPGLPSSWFTLREPCGQGTMWKHGVSGSGQEGTWGLTPAQPGLAQRWGVVDLPKQEAAAVPVQVAQLTAVTWHRPSLTCPQVTSHSHFLTTHAPSLGLTPSPPCTPARTLTCTRRGRPRLPSRHRARPALRSASDPAHPHLSHAHSPAHHAPALAPRHPPAPLLG